MKSNHLNCKIDDSVKLYHNVTINKSILSQNCSVGDFTKVDNSTLFNNVIIDKNNYVDNSTIDSYSYTGKNSYVIHSKIGKFCSISWNVTIGGGNHDYKRMSQHSFLYNNYSKIRPNDSEIPYNRFENSIEIGNDVWIATGAVITRGIKIGNGAVIGANAVVTKDIPAYSIAVGNPAKVIKYRFSTDIIELMEKIKWWDWNIEKIKEKFYLLSEEPNIKELEKLLKENNDTF